MAPTIREAAETVYGGSLEEINMHNVNGALRQNDPYRGLDPKRPDDARKILAQHERTPKHYEGLCEVIPRKVVDARVTLIE